MTIEKTLADRGKTYGPFLEKAKTVQALIDVVIHEPGWERLAADQKQCIMVCFDKFARAIHGDPNHRDNFHDVVGYAKLVDDRMAADEAKPVSPAEHALAGAAIRGAAKAMADQLAGGWIPWTGGGCPAFPAWRIDVQYASGERIAGIRADEVKSESWQWDPSIERAYHVTLWRLTPAPRT